MPMSHETSLVERDGRVATITLNRPKALNALNGQVMTEVTTAAAEFDADPRIGAIVIAGRPLVMNRAQLPVHHKPRGAVGVGFERCQPVTSRPSAIRAMLHSCTSLAPSEISPTLLSRQIDSRWLMLPSAGSWRTKP
jgi:hypothetical protein